jgi:putative FmdB family regulatory protein
VARDTIERLLQDGTLPTYSYKCKSCDHQFDQFQKITADPLTTCPECKQEELTKVITASGGVHFKGKGWYNSGGY